MIPFLVCLALGVGLLALVFGRDVLAWVVARLRRTEKQYMPGPKERADLERLRDAPELTPRDHQRIRAYLDATNDNGETLR